MVAGWQLVKGFAPALATLCGPVDATWPLLSFRNVVLSRGWLSTDSGCDCRVGPITQLLTCSCFEVFGLRRFGCWSMSLSRLLHCASPVHWTLFVAGEWWIKRVLFFGGSSTLLLPRHCHIVTTFCLTAHCGGLVCNRLQLLYRGYPVFWQALR
jgi:hypothetical protein